MPEGYKTVRGYAEKSFTEKKSEFIGYIMPVQTNDEAVDFINEIRSKHRKATHNVYAYILRDNSISRYSDDGEPQGTAGMPVFDVLRKEGLTDVCCVVTRYFGGILLGGGGLVRAYSHSAKIALDEAGIKTMCSCAPVIIKTDYNLYGKINYILPDFDVRITDTDFSDDVTLRLLVREEMCAPLRDKIIDISNGKADITVKDTIFGDFS